MPATIGGRVLFQEKTEQGLPGRRLSTGLRQLRGAGRRAPPCSPASPAAGKSPSSSLHCSLPHPFTIRQGVLVAQAPVCSHSLGSE